MWNPTSYLAYADERARPFADLVGRIAAEHPALVTDLGCGPGNLTASLAQRWPAARIVGIDSSPEMIDRARASGARAEFALLDVAQWVPAGDVVISNATLQWVPGHEQLLRRWTAALGAGSWLAFQVPGNFDAPSHRAIREVAADWPALSGVLRHDTVLDPAGYTRLLRAAGCAVDAWETTYLHVLAAPPASDHPVLTWLEGTGLRPVRAALVDDAWSQFRAALAPRLADAYPVREATVLFPFRRIFMVARVGAT